MKLATYNIRSGGNPRVHWAKLIDDLKIDLLLVQESASPEEHRPPLLYPAAHTRCVWERVKQNRWGTGIYSATGKLEKIAVPGFEGWVVGVEITRAEWHDCATSQSLVFSLHAPSTTESYSQQVNKILDEIVTIAQGRDVILGGDFNLTISKTTAAGRAVSKRDALIQARLDEELGLINCWVEANPNIPLAQTLRWSGDKTIPYHCDGLFVPKAWRERLLSCEVLSGEEWDRLSDHNPVLAEFA